ncbi:MAG: peptidylprolyl isomerase [Myxococcota bacterium]
MPYFWVFATLSAQAVPSSTEPLNVHEIRAKDIKTQLMYWQRLDSPNLEARTQRAEALFFIPESAETAIVLLRDETDINVRGILLLVIGKNGQASHLPTLLTPLQQRDALLSTKESVASLRALSMLASRGKLTMNRIELTGMLLQQRQVIDPVQRRLVATVLAQLDTPALPPAMERELIKAMRNEIDGEAASLLLKTIAQLRRPSQSIEELYSFWSEHSAWEVRAAYAQWFGWKDTTVAEILASDPSQQVRIQIQKSLAMKGVLPEWRKESLLQDASIQSYQVHKRGESSLYEEAKAFIESWSGESNEIFNALLKSEYPTDIRVAAVQALEDRQLLRSINDSADEIELKRAAAIQLAELSTTAAERKTLLNSGDHQIIAGTASVLAKEPKGNSEKDLWLTLDPDAPVWVNLSIMHALLSIHKQGKSRSSKDFVTKSLKPFKNHSNPAIHSMDYLLREAHELRAKPTVFEYPEITEPIACGLRMFTTAGEVRIAFNTVQSPHSIAHIQELVQSQSENSLNQFTQFTPQHTLQIGQNPPNIYILDEPNLFPFERGSVGIALRTPNSGGSQIFVSFRERPDFIGEYTHIGEVTYGMNTLTAYPFSTIQDLKVEFCSTDS